MHIPAAKSTEVAIKANLNSGLNIGTASRPLYSLDSVHGLIKKQVKLKMKMIQELLSFIRLLKML